MNEGKAPPTPNLERLADLTNEYDTQAIVEFLEWMTGRGIALCFWSPYTDNYEPTSKSIEDLLYEYVGIDRGACDRERQSLLKYIQSTQQQITEKP